MFPESSWHPIQTDDGWSTNWAISPHRLPPLGLIQIPADDLYLDFSLLLSFNCEAFAYVPPNTHTNTHPAVPLLPDDKSSSFRLAECQQGTRRANTKLIIHFRAQPRSLWPHCDFSRVRKKIVYFLFLQQFLSKVRTQPPYIHYTVSQASKDEV